MEKEDFLRTAGIVGTVGVLGGVTKSVRITLRNEQGTHDAHVQTIDQAAAKFEGRGGQWELNFRDTYKFNVAAYLLDRMLDLNMVPATVERIVDGKPSAVTWWIDDVLMDEKERLAKNVTPPRWARPNWNRQINILLVFDQLIANRDRNLGNIIITKNWTVWLIDHTRAFRMYKDLIDPGNLTACDRPFWPTSAGWTGPRLRKSWAAASTAWRSTGSWPAGTGSWRFSTARSPARGGRRPV